MLEKPNASDDDLDLIISNLYKESRPVKRAEQAVQKSMSMIDLNIESKTLPLALRKRLMFELATRPVA